MVLSLFLGTVSLDPGDVDPKPDRFGSFPNLDTIDLSLDINFLKSDFASTLSGVKYINETNKVESITPFAHSFSINNLQSGRTLSSAPSQASAAIPTGDDITRLDGKRISLSSGTDGILLRVFGKLLGTNISKEGFFTPNTLAQGLDPTSVINLTNWTTREFKTKDGSVKNLTDALQADPGSVGGTVNELIQRKVKSFDKDAGHVILSHLLVEHEPNAQNTADACIEYPLDYLWQKDADGNTRLASCPEEGVTLTFVLKTSLVATGLYHEEDNDILKLTCAPYPPTLVPDVDTGTNLGNRVLIRINLNFTESLQPYAIHHSLGWDYPLYTENPGLSHTARYIHGTIFEKYYLPDWALKDSALEPDDEDIIKYGDSTWERIFIGYDDTPAGSTTQGNTSLDAIPTTNTQSTPIPPSEEPEYTITLVECLYREIMEAIDANILNSYQPMNAFNETELLDEVMQELDYNNYFHDCSDSDNLFGFSDIGSVTSEESITVHDVKKFYSELLKSINNTDSYIDQLLAE